MLAPDLLWRPGRGDWARAGALAAALFILYALCSPRTVAVEDDGLFVLSSYFLGIEHSPGFPLFVLLGKLATLVPIGSVAYRVHLLSALFGGLACGAAWLCARALTGARLPAYVAALGLGFAPVYWSQAIIAEVYTLNVFLFLVLLLLGLRAGQGAALLPWLALVFGLSLTNHWPLMGLVAPGFAVLLWPRLPEVARRLPLLAALFAIGLLPYAWMVWRSWQEPIISYLGPLDSWREVWHVLSRASYAEIDERLSSTALDRLRFMPFVVSQVVYQLAFVGAALAAVGFWAQWRVWGRRVSGALTLMFLGPSLLLALLLGFDYDSFQKHVFHVYPLPAYAVAALWLGLGFAWCATRFLPRSAHYAAVPLLALMLAWGARDNMRADYDWAARYANTILRTLPPNALVFVQGDGELAPVGYFHMIEGARSDITLFQAQGLVLGNSLFHPLRTDQKTADERIRKLIDGHPGPVVFLLDRYTVYAQRDRWIYLEVDRSSKDPGKVTVDVPDEAMRFFEESVAPGGDSNAWAAYFQSELRKRYATVLGRSLSRDKPPDARILRHLGLLEKDFYGALGLAEGLLANPEGVPSTAVVATLLETARATMPPDTPKLHVSRYFYVRGLLRLALNDRRGAIADLDTSLSIWPLQNNPASELLARLHREAGDTRAADAVQTRIRRGRR